MLKVFGIVLQVMLAIMVLSPMFTSVNRATKTKACLYAQRVLAKGLLLYADDNDQLLPPKEWAVHTAPYLSKDEAGPAFGPLKCPAVDVASGSGFALLAGITRVVDTQDASRQVMLFETNMPGWDVVAPLSAMCTQSRHNNLYAIAFADGHVKAFNPQAVPRR